MAMGPEQVGSLLRPLPIFLEGRALVLAPAPAQELGLKPGQVIELVTALVDGRARLFYGDRALPLSSPVPFAPGDRRTFQVRANGANLMLVPLSPKRDEPALDATSSLRAAGPALSSLFRRLAEPRAGLLPQAKNVDTLFRLGAETPGPDPVGLPRPILGDLDGPLLKRALMQSGLFFEAQLAQGRALAPADFKRALLRILNQAAPQSELARVAGEITAGVERGQLESLLATQQRGELSLNWVVAFRDGPAVALELERQGGRAGTGTASVWVVHAATELSSLGPLWMRTRYTPGGEVAFTLWAPKAGTAELALAHEAGLRSELELLGLRLEKFIVHRHPRRDRADAGESQDG